MALRLPLSFNVCEGGYSCNFRKRGRKPSRIAIFKNILTNVSVGLHKEPVKLGK